MNRGRLGLTLLLTSIMYGQAIEVVRVASKPLTRNVPLTGDFLPYQSVDLHARVEGFVEKVLVDRGSLVKRGELLIVVSAPEMEAQLAEAQAKAKAVESQISEAKAKLTSTQSTYERMKAAAATPGAISGNELVTGEQAVEAAKGAVASAESSRAAAQAAVDAVAKLQQYLNITAPFAGVITDRMVHPGALAASSSGPLLRLEQVSRLRLVVAVPEANFAGISRGARVPFRVTAYPDRNFTGVVQRIARSVDPKTRTMSVELDVDNTSGALAPGMYAEVSWPVRGGAGLVVPSTSIVTTTERLFVIRVNKGRAEWVDVKRGARDGAQVQVFGNLAEGDTILLRGSDEIRNGAVVQTAPAKSPN
jgi:membrane fusion protein, multidrug efflux system